MHISYILQLLSSRAAGEEYKMFFDEGERMIIVCVVVVGRGHFVPGFKTFSGILPLWTSPNKVKNTVVLESL